ncbi:hypothetical protein ACFWV1_11160 [Streptomyces sp. NPDC058700]|uniref:hypothetical protein n=1 Tax=Streptomyces sp. NPDC058700 TaxID=3346607 RepID=UPI00365FCD67
MSNDVSRATVRWSIPPRCRKASSTADCWDVTASETNLLHSEVWTCSARRIR